MLVSAPSAVQVKPLLTLSLYITGVIYPTTDNHSGEAVSRLPLVSLHNAVRFIPPKAAYPCLSNLVASPVLLPHTGLSFLFLSVAQRHGRKQPMNRLYTRQPMREILIFPYCWRPNLCDCVDGLVVGSKELGSWGAPSFPELLLVRYLAAKCNLGQPLICRLQCLAIESYC